MRCAAPGSLTDHSALMKLPRYTSWYEISMQGVLCTVNSLFARVEFEDVERLDLHLKRADLHVCPVRPAKLRIEPRDQPLLGMDPLATQ
jgi:hypothetical protein